MLIASLLLVANTAVPAPSPIRVESRVQETVEGPLRFWVARVDLFDPRVSFVVTGPLARADAPDGAEARLLPTDTWALQEGVDLAVNANFFARVDGPGPPARGWTDALPVDVVGLARSEGRTVSPPRQDRGSPDPALAIDEADGRCPCSVRAALITPAELNAIDDAVAGMGGRDGQPGTLLVENGSNRGATAQVAPLQRHPRTAAGVSRDGRTLVLIVADGRRPGWSIGATLPELAAMMLDAGAWNGVNLDGGGSSALWYREPGDPTGRVLNRPSDGRVRPAAVHLGVRLAPIPPPERRDPRPGAAPPQH